MPLVKIHEEAYASVKDYGFLAKLAMDCVYRRMNDDMVCGIICLLLKKQVLGCYIDSSKIQNEESLQFFQKQFDRAVVSI